MSSRIVSFLALSLLISVCAMSQSLGDLARKERERREKNKDSGVAAREFSEDEIFEEEDEPADSDEDAAEGESDDETPAPSSLPLPNRIDIEVDPSQSENLEEASRDRKQDEAEWRNRFYEARQRLKIAREQKAVWDGVHYVEGISLVDENGNVVVDNLDDLRRYVAEANQEFTDAEQALERLEEQARRAGVPPGWLR